MKKIILSICALGALTLSFSAENIEQTKESNIYLTVDSEIGKQLFQSELAYKEYLEKEAIQNVKIARANNLASKNSCEIVKLKKALAKLIKLHSQNNSRKVINIKDLPKLNVETEKATEILTGKKKPKVACKKKLVKVIDTSHIKESYFAYKTPKKFKVTYNKAGEFEYPLIDSKVNKMLHKNDRFEADMYTKAGWVHKVNGGWVKGYKLWPKVLNKTTKEDIKKWGMKYKTVEDCKTEGGK